MGGSWPQFQMHLLMQIPWIPSPKSFSHSLLPVRIPIFKSLPDLHFQPYLPNFSLGKLAELHHKLNFHVPSKLIYWNLISRVMVLEVRSLGGTLMNGISALIKETRRAPLPLPSCHHVKAQEEDSHLWNRKRASPDTESAGAYILDFPASRTMRNRCLPGTQSVVFLL